MLKFLGLGSGVSQTPAAAENKASEEKLEAKASEVDAQGQQTIGKDGAISVPESEPQATPAKKAARDFTVRAGSALGMSHLQKRRNNQDAYVVQSVEVKGKRFRIGLVADGSTGIRKGEKQRGSSKNEVGASLLAMFAFSEIRLSLSLGIPLAEIPKALYQRCIGFIGNLARITVVGQPEEHASFIAHFCLCTLLGFIMDDSTLITFASGDGFFVVNDRLQVIDKNDQALYLGYHQVDRRFIANAELTLPDSFEEVNVYDVAHLDRFAMGTDGMLQRSEKHGLYLDSAEVTELFEYRPQAPAGLQWWLNKAQSERERFSDDTTLITLLWKQSQGESEVHHAALDRTQQQAPVGGAG